MGTGLKYYNPKTKGYINFWAENEEDIETFNILSKKMLKNDERILKNKMTKLVNVLKNLGGKKERI